MAVKMLNLDVSSDQEFVEMFIGEAKLVANLVHQNIVQMYQLGRIDGNLYITRHGKGTVVKMSPQGEILQEINVLGKHPTNICFGGPDGCTAYVTEVEHRRVVSFRVERPGLAWHRWQHHDN